MFGVSSFPFIWGKIDITVYWLQAYDVRIRSVRAGKWSPQLAQLMPMTTQLLTATP